MKKTIAQKIQSIYDGKEPALVGLRRLAGSSSTLTRCLKVAEAPSEPKVKEMLAANFLNCYCAGFVAGIDFKPELEG